MTAEEARFPSQADEDRREAFNQHDYGLPYCDWLYWHRSGHTKRAKAPDMDAPYQDPVSGRMQQLKRGTYAEQAARPPLKRKVVSQEIKDLTEKLKRPPVPDWLGWWHNQSSEMDPVTVRETEHRQRQEEEERRADRFAASMIVPWSTKFGDQRIECTPMPASMMVPREEYLAHLRQLMREWGVNRTAEFDEYRERLIKHALYRMGKL